MRNWLGIWLLAGSVLQAGDWSQVRSWVCQLTDYEDGKLRQIEEAQVDLAVIDLTRDGASGYFAREEIAAVKDSGKLVLAYFEIGAIEEFRPEWAAVPASLKAGKVGGWPNEQYVRYWDERWWPIVQGRVDRALAAGFDGAYLDLVTAYEEIPGTGLAQEERARRMVDLISKISGYAKSRKADFRIVPQNCPELYTWSYWEPVPNRKYLDAIDGIGLESVFYLAHDKPADQQWCQENRDNALAIRKAGKLVLGLDYAKRAESIADAYHKQRELGFVPYVSVRELNAVVPEAGVGGRPRRR